MIKKNTYLSITLFFIILNIGLAQETIKQYRSEYLYMKINDFKKRFPYKILTKQDSLNFIFKENDTLVRFEDDRKKVSIPYEYKDSTFLELYKKIAFNPKKNDSGEQYDMKYWKEDIKIFFGKSIEKKVKNEIVKFVESLDRMVDSLHIQIVNKHEKSNYIIYYQDDYEYESELINSKTDDYYIFWKNNIIYKGAIKINPIKHFNETLRINKIKTLFIQTLGYFHFINDINCENYFSSCYLPNKTLTDLDKEILKYHYSYGICKGTDKETFEEQHKKAKDVLKTTGRKLYFRHAID